MTAVHPDCGEPFGPGHVCRDYVAWHEPAGTRHPDDLDVPDGWVPGRRVVEVPGPVPLRQAA